jgi:hypothetical protein
MFLPPENFQEQFKVFTRKELEFVLFALNLKPDIEKAPENLQTELINQHCVTNRNKIFLKQNCKIFVLP